ncbi:eukaryotic translation initiation factor 4B-like isoform X1 [Colletes gigas]|uniref:eukaryotic translation initiation factor 4B-like isoform X1 n=1 Tax=Colletes gigas TaxID=935657 RepID=UPI001C9B6F7C|nr:eukaryotic translation initiation factor 4B-like isoform X1 [Colletes gigas]
MSSGKKGKKKKGTTVDLMSFLADGGATPAVPVKPLSWADEMEEDHEGFTSRSSKEPVVLPTAPRAARDPRGTDDDVPTNPPYVAYLSNLPYEVDEGYLTEFFTGMKISNIRLPKDTNKLKGFGYVEFEDRQSLIDALNLSNTPMKARRVRIDVSNSINDDRRGGRMGRDNRRDNYDDVERTSGDWRSGTRDENAPAEGDTSYRSRYDNRDRDRRDDREAPEAENKPGAWRENSDRGRPAFRDRGGFRDDERERDRDRDWGGSRYDRGSRDRNGDKGGSFGPRRNYGDSDWNRDKDRDVPRRADKPSLDSKPETKTRPKLNLTPRTKPIEPIAVKEEQSAAPAHTPSTNIFGAAKPVDTTVREREIEERLAKSYAESKSREDGDSEKRGKEGTWVKRNGEGRDEKDKEQRSRPTWRMDEDKSRRNEVLPSRSQFAHTEQYAEPRSQPALRPGLPAVRTPQRLNETRAPERDRKDKEKDDASKMPKARDEPVPDFIFSNKYFCLPDDVGPDSDEN